MDKVTIRSLKNKNKVFETNDYFNLDVYGIAEKEITLEHEDKKQESFFTKLRKGNVKGLAASAAVKDEEVGEAETDD